MRSDTRSPRRAVGAAATAGWRRPANPRAVTALSTTEVPEIVAGLADGRPDDAAAIVEDLPEDHVLRLVTEADVRLRRGEGSVAQAHALLLHPEVAPGGTYWLWVQAVVADQLLIDGDVAAAEVAAAALDRVSDDPLLELPSLSARGRLRRVVALHALAADDPTERELGRTARDAATTDLRRCGFDAEVAITRVLAAGVQALFPDDDTLERLQRLAQVHAALAGHRSVWMPAVTALVALAALQTGDHSFARRVLDEAGDTTPRTDPLSRLYGAVRSVAAVVMSGAAPPAMAALDEQVAVLTNCHLLFARMCAFLLAHTLLDLGDPRAVHFAGHALDLPETGPVVRAETELLRCRLSVTGGQTRTAEHVLAQADRMVAGGRARDGAIQALRLASDLAGVGSADEAATLVGWAESHLPGPARRTPIEQYWCDRARGIAPGETAGEVGGPPPAATTALASAQISGRLGDAVTLTVTSRYETRPRPAAPAPPGTISIRLLHPVPSVEVDGRETILPESQARLVVFVVLGHPRPLHIEQLGDRLWPDVPLQQVRVRMNSLLYRLRRSLGDGSDELIERSGDLVRLRPDACTVDLFDLWDQVAAGGAAGGAALASVRSNLCPAHDPYDDHLIEARRHFAGEWATQARLAVRHQVVTVDELTPAAQALEIDVDELVPPAQLAPG